MTQDTPVWFITGCSTGFGREIAGIALNKGWRCVVTARDAAKVQDFAGTYGERALALPLDVDKPEQIAEAVRRAEATFGRIDVLVNNAGYGYFSALEDGEDAEIRAMFETNVFGLVNMTKAVLPGMRARKSGHVINFSSIGGLVGFPGIGYYNATKFAVEGLSEAMAAEVAPLGIKVLVVEPGPFRTDWAGRSLKHTQNPINDYDATAGARYRQTAAYSGNQAGDPVKAAQAIVDSVESGAAPLRLLLGKMAYDTAHAKLEAMKENFKATEAVTLGADSPPKSRAA